MVRWNHRKWQHGEVRFWRKRSVGFEWIVSKYEIYIITTSIFFQIDENWNAIEEKKWSAPQNLDTYFEVQIVSYPYQFRLKIIKLVTEQDYGIREVAKLHKISHALVIYWLKAFRERGLDGVKSPHTNLQTPKIVKPKMKKKDIEIPETTDFSPKAFKKLQRELALARAEIAYLKEWEALDRQKQRQKKEKWLKDWSQTTH